MSRLDIPLVLRLRLPSEPRYVVELSDPIGKLNVTTTVINSFST